MFYVVFVATVVIVRGGQDMCICSRTYGYKSLCVYIQRPEEDEVSLSEVSWTGGKQAPAILHSFLHNIKISLIQHGHTLHAGIQTQGLVLAL